MLMLKEQALYVLAQLEENGYEAFFVGGCVRDWLLKRPVHDIDICTNAQPCDIMRIFPDHIPTGLQHGTVSVKHDGAIFEVTTYRAEAVYSDHRRPDEVRFVSDLREDLARRDFTINAMAMDRHGRLSDPFSGQTDLLSGLVRTVGSAQERFTEDALRLLRAARFAAQLQFDLDGKTEQALADCADLLRHIAPERVRVELCKLIGSDYPWHGVAIVNRAELLRVYPELDQLFKLAAPYIHRLRKLTSLAEKWALLLYASGATNEAALSLVALLRMSNRERDKIALLLHIVTEMRPSWDEPESIGWEHALLRYGPETCVEANNLLQAIWREQDEATDSHSQSVIDTYERLPVKSLKELAVTGKDLLTATDKTAGPWIAHTLQHLLEQVALYHKPNTPEWLLAEGRKEVERYEHQTGNTERVSGKP
ncbi:UNVERIFIED_CONTAM: tRNA nucleotidyltransferase (CCA-adding enzyme) [Brevibacillus sp. OAP136]